MKTTFATGPARQVSRIAVVVCLSVLAVLVGCSKKDKGAASQTAAKVNKEEITVHEINFVLQQQRGLRPDQQEAASKQVLERLIDQELAVQKAEELKLDRDPRVVQQMEAAKREIIARAYVEKIGEGVSRPTPDEIKKYFDATPALFTERKIYSLQELAIDAKPEQIGALRDKLAGSKTITEFVDYLKANDIHFTGNQAVRPAEQLPMPVLTTLSKMSEGQSVLTQTPTGAQVLVLAGVRAQPVDLARATPAIDQFLTNERKRDLVTKTVKDLRAAASIQYVGKFAEGASAPADSAGAIAAPAVATAPAADATASAAAAPVPATTASGGLDAASINKGMGIK